MHDSKSLVRQCPATAFNKAKANTFHDTKGRIKMNVVAYLEPSRSLGLGSSNWAPSRMNTGM